MSKSDQKTDSKKAAETAPKSDPKKAPATVLVVRSKTDRFRRAGILFTREGIELDPAQLTESQVEAIGSEPNLIISVGGEVMPFAPAKIAKA